MSATRALMLVFLGITALALLCCSPVLRNRRKRGVLGAPSDACKRNGTEACP